MPNFTIPSARHEPNFSETRHSGWSKQGLEVYNEACKSIKKECQDAEKAAEFARQFEEAAILEKQGKKYRTARNNILVAYNDLQQEEQEGEEWEQEDDETPLMNNYLGIIEEV